MGRKPSVTRDQLIENALDCFIEFGFEETTFQRIAKKVGVTQPAIYSYFNNKMDLLAEGCLWAAAKGRSFIDAQVDPKKPAMERLRQYLNGNLVFFKKHPKEAYAITAIFFFSHTNEALMEIFQQIQETATERIESILLQISYEKNKSLKDSLQMAQSIHSLLIGEMYKSVHLGRHFKLEDRVNIMMKCVDGLLKQGLS